MKMFLLVLLCIYIYILQRNPLFFLFLRIAAPSSSRRGRHIASFLLSLSAPLTYRVHSSLKIFAKTLNCHKSSVCYAGRFIKAPSIMLGGWTALVEESQEFNSRLNDSTVFNSSLPFSKHQRNNSFGCLGLQCYYASLFCAVDYEEKADRHSFQVDFAVLPSPQCFMRVQTQCFSFCSAIFAFLFVVFLISTQLGLRSTIF